MSELSDYKRCVSDPLEASLRATIAKQRAAIRDLEAENARLRDEVSLVREGERTWVAIARAQEAALSEIIDLSALSVVGGDDFDRGARAARLEAADIARAALSGRTGT